MDRFETLKHKYASVLSLIKARGINLTNLHVDNDKLYMKGSAPSQEILNEMWDQIKVVDPTYSDLSSHVVVDTSMPQRAKPPRTYTVVKGDSLWKIAQQFYGNGSLYQKIIAANPGKLRDERSIIYPGDVLNVPEQNA